MLRVIETPPRQRRKRNAAPRPPLTRLLQRGTMPLASMLCCVAGQVKDKVICGRGALPMARTQGKSLRQLSGEATRYAEWYFDPAEQVRMLQQEGRPVDGDYALLVMNRFVPIDWVPDSATILRRFVRGTLAPAEMKTVKEYWGKLESTIKELGAMFEAGEPTAHVKAAARDRRTWPAVGVAESETELRSLLMTQFEAIRRGDIAWQCVDSSTYPRPKPDGIYVLVDWFWHGW